MFIQVSNNSKKNDGNLIIIVEAIKILFTNTLIVSFFSESYLLKEFEKQENYLVVQTNYYFDKFQIALLVSHFGNE
jgi:hypothetical protein